VDDSLVRGTTSRKIVKMVKAAGAREVHLRISCPPTISRASTAWTRRAARAHRRDHTIDEIRKYVGADTLGYLSLDGLRAAVGKRSAVLLHVVLHRRVSVAFPRNEQAYLQLSLKAVD
jgi:amidophosphoribosyltransferase